MKNIFLFILLLSNTFIFSNELDSLISVLEKEMVKHVVYDQVKELRIENLKKLIDEKSNTLENKYFLTNKLISEYEYYSFDNTLLYMEISIELARKMDAPYFLQKAVVRLSKLLATSGRYKESLDMLNEIRRFKLHKDLLKDYYFIQQQCFVGLKSNSKVKSLKEKYHKLFFIYKDSLEGQMSNFEPNTLDYLKSIEDKYRTVKSLEEALEINSKRLSLVKFGTREYSMVAYERSYTNATLDGDGTFGHKKYLILSAISDIQASVKDNASLTDLAKILFEEGDIDSANKYIDYSFEDAKFYNSKLRFLNISNILHEISKSFETKNLSQSKKLKNQLFFISILSLILIVALFYIYRQIIRLNIIRKELKSANEKLISLNEKLIFTNKDLKLLYDELSASDKIKEHYIGTFLNLYSDYIDKLDVYRKMVRKYLTTNKINALLELTKSKHLVDNELKIFNSNFDESFLHIYPNFIENLNTLLNKDEQIVVKNGEILNTELRIFALIRLGITNSSKISKILRYSVNTIYNYRVKVRNAAIDRDNFENQVKKTV